MNNIENQTSAAQKKQWVAPKMEVISSDVIQTGDLPSLPEGIPSVSGNFYGSAAS